MKELRKALTLSILITDKGKLTFSQAEDGTELPTGAGKHNPSEHRLCGGTFAEGICPGLFYTQNYNQSNSSWQTWNIS